MIVWYYSHVPPVIFISQSNKYFNSLLISSQTIFRIDPYTSFEQRHILPISKFKIKNEYKFMCENIVHDY